MPNLSIKDVPEALAEALRQRAARNHRSLQGELMALLEAATQTLVATQGVREPAVAAHVTAVTAVTGPPAGAGKDDLLARLDAIVAGSQWGSAPLLTREQIHERRLMRELEYDARRSETAT